MKLLKRIIFLALMIGLGFLWQLIGVRYAEDVSGADMYAAQWTFRLAFLFIEGLLAYGFVAHMSRGEKILWGFGLLVLSLIGVYLAFMGNEKMFGWIVIMWYNEPPFSFLGALLLLSGILDRKKNRA